MILIQLISSFFGSLGFAMVFNVRKQDLIPSAIGGVIVCGVYFLAFEWRSLGFFLSSLIAGAICQIYAEVLARLLKSPSTVFYISALIPLIPGGSLYRTMDAVVAGEWELFRLYGSETLQVTFGLAIGVSFISALLFLFRRKKQKN